MPTKCQEIASEGASGPAHARRNQPFLIPSRPRPGGRRGGGVEDATGVTWKAAGHVTDVTSCSQRVVSSLVWVGKLP